MLDIGMSELLLIGVVALIVVGPKDLPRMFNALGRMTGKARGMAREFQRAMDDAAKSSGLDDVRKDINGLRNVAAPGKLGINALEEAANRFDKWDATKAIKTATGTATDAGAVVTAAPPAAGTAAAAELTTPSGTAAATVAAAPTGPATAALAEQKAAEQAASRQKALELQAQRTTDAAKKWAEKAAEKTAADTVQAAPAADAAPVSEKPAKKRAAKPAAAKPAKDPDANLVSDATVEAKPKPARKPPVRAKKSDA
jgi:sec-independent protein translocase protein TatB